jgi:hypothetical protein
VGLEQDARCHEHLERRTHDFPAQMTYFIINNKKD